MNAPLYTLDILRLATSIPHMGRLEEPMGSARRRSPVCGSELTVDIDFADGRVSAVGMTVAACAFGQASASLLAAHVVGHTPAELAEARDALANWLSGEGEMPDWPDIDLLAPALPAIGRHASIRLAFEAAAEAAALAGGDA